MIFALGCWMRITLVWSPCRNSLRCQKLRKTTIRLQMKLQKIGITLLIMQNTVFVRIGQSYFIALQHKRTVLTALTFPAVGLSQTSRLAMDWKNDVAIQHFTYCTREALILYRSTFCRESWETSIFKHDWWLWVTFFNKMVSPVGTNDIPPGKVRCLLALRNFKYYQRHNSKFSHGIWNAEKILFQEKFLHLAPNRLEKRSGIYRAGRRKIEIFIGSKSWLDDIFQTSRLFLFVLKSNNERSKCLQHIVLINES